MFSAPTIVLPPPPPPRAGVFARPPTPDIRFPIQHVTIDWDRLVAKRPLVLETDATMPAYLIKPEVLALLDAEKDPMHRLILDLMWTTGARVSEVFAITPGAFVDDGYDVGVILKTLKQHSGRPTNAALARSPKRYVPIVDPLVRDRIATYLCAGGFKRGERMFPIVRQTVTRRIHKLVARVVGAPFNVTAHTFGIRLRFISCCTGDR